MTCRRTGLANGRCYMHGGRNRGNPRPRQDTLQAGALRAHARYRAAGLKWPGGPGPLPKLANVVKRMAAGEKRADQLLLELEGAAVAPAASEEGQLAPLLHDGTREGLILARDTVRMVRAELESQGAKADVKLLRLGNDAGLQLARLSMRMAETEFQKRKGDAIEKLLAAIAAEASK